MKRLCLITGKMLDVPSVIDRVDKLPRRVTPSMIAQLADEMAQMRTHWASDQSFRTSGRGHQYMRKYRKLASDFKALTGTDAPSIYADI